MHSGLDLLHIPRSLQRMFFEEIGSMARLNSKKVTIKMSPEENTSFGLFPCVPQVYFVHWCIFLGRLSSRKLNEAACMFAVCSGSLPNLSN